ncbi:MAG: phosphoglycerate kinase [Candidatus Omnitrophica bacterium]|nr:phosphoglycerate kinase [Candidatus Omnitrophota bacterium]
MNKKSIRDVDIKNKRVIMRVDFNVPQDENLNITDDARIRAAVPTIEYAIGQRAKVILMSHLGRPKGGPEPKFSLRPVAQRLSELIGRPVKMAPDCVGDEVKKITGAMKPGDVVMLENVRVHKEEEANDPGFAKSLASLGDVYVNDAFGTAHRAHASTEGVTRYLASVSGFLVQKEIEYFEKAVSNPAKPYVAILGGAKVSDKIEVIKNLMKKVDAILIGGGMAYTLLKAKGIEIGKSKLEADKAGLASEILLDAKKSSVKILLPVDHVAADKLEPSARVEVTKDAAIPAGLMGLDIGPKTVKLFEEELKNAKTIIWNGPLGVFEMPPFDKGSREIAKFISGLKATTIIGGGDTAAAIAKFGLEAKMSHISTGGGASLEYLEGKTLPGIAALQDS